jgi:hypothetical protein
MLLIAYKNSLDSLGIHQFESMNRFVKWAIGSELADRHLAGDNTNWMEILGSVTSSIYSQHVRILKSTSSYKAIFGQSYDQDIM